MDATNGSDVGCEKTQKSKRHHTCTFDPIPSALFGAVDRGIGCIEQLDDRAGWIALREAYPLLWKSLSKTEILVVNLLTRFNTLKNII